MASGLIEEWADWAVWEVGWLASGLFGKWAVWEVGWLGSGLVGKWAVWEVGCLGSGLFGICSLLGRCLQVVRSARGDEAPDPDWVWLFGQSREQHKVMYIIH